jgi:hypothetical protein
MLLVQPHVGWQGAIGSSCMAFLSRGMDLGRRDREVMLCAARQGRTDVLGCLVDEVVIPFSREGGEGSTALHMACREGQDAMMEVPAGPGRRCAGEGKCRPRRQLDLGLGDGDSTWTGRPHGVAGMRSRYLGAHRGRR